MRPLTRRATLLGLSAVWSLGRSALAFGHAPTSRRLVVVILRGALDGLAAVVPYGDPALGALRPKLVPAAVGAAGGMLDLGGFYGLHPALGDWHDLYARGEVLPIHAVAGHYRSRSHFEAQDYMESGADQRMTSGWLNRAAAALTAQQGAGGAGGGSVALSIGLSMPLLLRGAAPVGSFAPESGQHPSPDLYARIAALSAADPVLGAALQTGLRSRGFSAGVLGDTSLAPGAHEDFSALASACGKLLAAPDGPRLAALELGGWDTHAAQVSRLGGPLAALGAGMIALKDGLGPAWRETAVLVMTEFGRTVRQNGTGGTDHGTGTVAFVLGGAIKGGRVAGTWPGLNEANLLDNRDLQPTTDLRSVAKGLLTAHLGLNAKTLAAIFPNSTAAEPMGGLVREG